MLRSKVDWALGLKTTLVLLLVLVPFSTIHAEERRFSAHRDNYLLPFYHESKVNQSRYETLNPNGHAAKDTFVQFQLSVKYKLLAWDEHGVFLGYTQRSNWEAYDDSAYFRDDQYNPELFYRFTYDAGQLSVGFEHQSNGAGGDYEVSWNRAYVDAQWQFDTVSLRFKPWVDIGSNNYNPDIVDFLGYGEAELGWQPLVSHEVKLTIANLFTKDWQKGAYRVSWRFPLYQGLNGYLKAETGYGLTISNYDFDESAFGAGFAFNF
ncbi:phospholipase A1 [Vibrio ichthyoenteri ATCC 700023]|uniref:Phospholipase A1 n=1 Tax=Vibrio ichthyoenteri ATCC 700023 TaxID=870968 RepID=F9S185_9VIBR|nr:phospholipase A [Vibrio ichthyoenteri]EGU42128.1 phospholipase A1 [Vibrio ichthyoenteri ATCC 700023]